MAISMTRGVPVLHLDMMFRKKTPKAPRACGSTGPQQSDPGNSSKHLTAGKAAFFSANARNYKSPQKGAEYSRVTHRYPNGRTFKFLLVMANPVNLPVGPWISWIHGLDAETNPLKPTASAPPSGVHGLLDVSPGQSPAASPTWPGASLS